MRLTLASALEEDVELQIDLVAARLDGFDRILRVDQRPAVVEACAEIVLDRQLRPEARSGEELIEFVDREVGIGAGSGLPAPWRSRLHRGDGVLVREAQSNALGKL